MRFAVRLVCLLCSLAWAAVLTWRAFRGERGVEADDPDKEREPQ